ncbi:hypothetical protein STAQ_37790 [Allostella sp. ATCC 35155]|nr:hypothetical protein STAQ_37790 [Stella sp. ATCC 35155]
MLRSPEVALLTMAEAPFRRRAGLPAEAVAIPAPPALPPPGPPAVARGGFGLLGDRLGLDELTLTSEPQ